MAQIVTLTINPAVDKSTSVPNLIAEKKLNCDIPKYEPGGGGINVSRALKRLGSDSTAIFPASGRTGERLQELLRAEGIEIKAVKTRNETRENFTVVDSSTNQQYRFGMPGPELSTAEASLFFNTIQNLSPQWLVLSGSLPPGISENFYADIARKAKDRGAKIIVDTSGESLKQCVEEGAFLIKPNLGELSNLVGVNSLDHQSVPDAAKELIAKGKCEIIVVSLGAQGACLVTKDIVETIATPTVKKLSTVGAGDSMVAGMVHVLSNGGNLHDMVRMGVACGTAATMNPGTQLFKRADAECLYEWLKRGNVGLAKG